MKIVVCIKQVPEAGEARFDATTRRLDRGAATGVINPFDRRAIALAVELTRRFGGTSTAITLGPPQAREVLVEALASGIDDAVHLCDPSCAGSDTLATARALAAAIGKLGTDLVLCGKYTVDGETGQVGPEIAELLGLPQITGARKLEVVAEHDGYRLDAERESDEGYERVSATLPALVTTAERLIQPIKPEAEAMARAATAAIRTWTARELGIAAERLGEAGSPTVVLALRDTPVARPAPRLERGSLDAQAEALAAIVRAWRATPSAAPRCRPLPTEAAGRTAAGDVWVVAEHTLTGQPTRATLELLGEAAWLARRLGGAAVALVFDERLPAATLAAHGADRILAIVTDAAAVTAEPKAAALAALISAHRPHTLLFAASERGRDVAPRVAARLGLGLTGDCIGLALDARGRLLQLKPALGTAVVAPIWSRTTPQLATVRPGSFPLPVADPTRRAAIERETPRAAVARQSRLHDSIVDIDPTWLPLDGAVAVVGVGTGIGGPEALPLVRRFAATFGAALGATRRVIDRGWLPRQLQIGITGRIIAPDLYVAVGIRGASNHTIGIAGSHTIVAINPDPEATIFSIANVGLVADFRPLLERACELLR